MQWLKTLRKQVLKINQEALALVISSSQSTLSKLEKGETGSEISGPQYVKLQSYVKFITGIDLPPIWFFEPPTDENILCHFRPYLNPGDVQVTGTETENFPAAPTAHLAPGKDGAAA